MKVTCIKCGTIIKENTSKSYTSICEKCAGELVDNMSIKDLVAHAKIGFDAIIDQKTGYDKIRPKGDLNKRFKEYKDGK